MRGTKDGVDCSGASIGRAGGAGGAWLALLLMVGLVVPGVAGAIDLCGCEGSPDSLGAFNSEDSSTWPPGSSLSQGFNIRIPLPADGVLIFDSMTIGRVAPNSSFATITFFANAANTGLTLLVAGNVTLQANATIRLDGGAGSSGSASGAGVGGFPGPGGFKGGDGAHQLLNFNAVGGAGLGPGGGRGGTNSSLKAQGGTLVAGPELRPLLGGGGGGGGFSTSTGFSGSCGAGGGGGGGGALLLVANGTVRIDGIIQARGGNGGNRGNSSCSSVGAGGAGGAIRVVANRVRGFAQQVTVTGGVGSSSSTAGAGNGANGRIRLEGFTLDISTSNFFPPAERSPVPGPVVNPLQPTVRIASVGGVVSPAVPRGNTGRVDVVVPAPGVVTVDLETQDVPSGTTVDLDIKPKLGPDLPGTTLTLDPVNCDGLGFCTASTALDLDAGAYFFEAKATFQVP